jgi:hypothetical protein
MSCLDICLKKINSGHLPEKLNRNVRFAHSLFGLKIRAWRKAALIVFAIPPTSAASERVFSLLDAMFGKDRDGVLADLIQAALMSR